MDDKPVEKMKIRIEFDCSFSDEETRLELVGVLSHFFDGYNLEVIIVEDGEKPKTYNIKHYLA